MPVDVVVAHAEGDEELAAALAVPLQQAGYEVVYQGTTLVGESLVEHVSRVLSAGGPVVLCGTVRAVGTPWAHRVVSAARRHRQGRIFAVQMDKDVYLDQLALDGKVAPYWQDPAGAIQALLVALERYYPPVGAEGHVAPGLRREAELRYRELALKSCDIIDLANLPESDRHLATKRLELRRLYVALRVWVERGAGGELSEEELTAIERRRDALRLRDADRALPELGEMLRDRDRVPVGSRLARARRLVVLGDPGAGKTTLLRWIATAFLLRLRHDPDLRDLPDIATLPDDDWLPILVRCRDLDTTQLGGTLDDVLLQVLRKAELDPAQCDLLRALLRDKLHAGEAVLLVDGLDEIADIGVRARFCEQLEQIHRAHPAAPIVVTSRIYGYREMGRRLGYGFEHVTVADLSKEDKDDFARRWCALTEPGFRRQAATEDLIRDIHSADRIERLTANPMLLTTMALVKRKVGKLPSRRADLYAEAVNVLLNWRREVDEPIDYHEAVPQLEYIAYAMCDRGIQRLREDELLDLVGRMRADHPQVYAASQHTPQEFLRLLEGRTGILSQGGFARHHGRLMPMYEFRHLTLQEYLAGLALVDGRFPGRDRSRSLTQNVAPLAGRILPAISSEQDDRDLAVSENWREPIRLCIATCNDDDVDHLLQAVLEAGPDEDAAATARPRAVLAALCLADEPNASQEAVHDVLAALIAQTGHDSGSGSEADTALGLAARELSESRWAKSFHALLIEAFKRRHGGARVSVGTLYIRGVERVLPEREDAICGWLREQVIGIADQDDTTAIGAALDIVAAARSRASDLRDQRWILREACGGLLKLVERGAAASHAASWALAELENHGLHRAKQLPAQAVAILAAIVADPGADPQAVRHLVRVLGWYGLRQAVKPLHHRLGDQDSSVREEAARALGRLEDSRSVGPLLARLTDDSPEVRAAACWALGQLEATRTIEQLLALLGDPTASVRAAAARAVAYFPAAHVLGPLHASRSDGDPEVRSAIAGAIGTAGGRHALEPLLAFLEDGDTAVRQQAVRWLGWTRFGRAVPPLMACLDDDSPTIRSSAAQGLGLLGARQALAPLVARLADEDASVRRQAAQALGELGDNRAVEPLLACFADADEDVRGQAARALGRLKDRRALEGLLERLEDTSLRTRRNATRALGDLETAGAFASLLACLTSSRSSIRAEAAQALGAMGDSRAVDPLLARLDDEDDDVRARAASALGELGDTRAVEPLLAQVSGGSVQVREEATVALGELGDDRAITALTERLADDSIHVACSAARALRDLGSAAALPALLRCLDDTNIGLRKEAAWALGNCDDGRALEPLSACLDDEHNEVRQKVAWSLGELKDGRAVASLLGHLDDREPARLFAVWSLGHLGGDDRALTSLSDCLTDADASIRSTAAYALGALKDGRAVAPLLACVDDDDSDVRKGALWAGSRLADRKALSCLLAALDDEVAEVRAGAAQDLDNCHTSRATQALTARLDDPNLDVRCNVIWTLGKLRDSRAVEPLLVRLEDASSPAAMQRAAILALGKLRYGPSLGVMLGRLQDPNGTMRQHAAWSLGRLGDPRAVNALADRLTDGNHRVRAAAAWALGQIEDARALEPLVQCLNDHCAGIREQAAYALGQLSDTRVVPSLLDLLDDEHARVRIEAAEALGSLRDPRALAPLIRLLDDPSGSVRQAAAWALGRLQNRQAVTSLLRCLDDPVRTVQTRAAWALARLRHDTAFDLSHRDLQDSNADARAWAAWGFGELGDFRAVDALIDRLADDDPTVRKASAWALGQLEQVQAVDPLLAATEDSNGSVRANVAEALGKLADRRALRPLLAALEDEHIAVRADAASALGKLGNTVVSTTAVPQADASAPSPPDRTGEPDLPAIVDALIKRLGDATTSVRREAAVALGLLGEPAALDSLLACLDGEQQDLRADVAMAIARIATPGAIHTFIQRLQHDRAPHSAPARVLLLLSQRDAAEELLARHGTTDPGERAAVALALGLLGEPRTGQTLLDLSTDSDDAVRGAAVWALGRLNRADLLDRLFKGLGAAQVRRREAVGALAQHVWKTKDYRLLTVDLDGERPFWDPERPIDADRVHVAAQVLRMTEDEVRSRYEELARRIPLRLVWLRNDNPTGD